MRRVGSENKTYFIGIYNKLTLDLLPLLVREQDDVLYSVTFEEGLCLGNGCYRKEGLKRVGAKDKKV